MRIVDLIRPLPMLFRARPATCHLKPISKHTDFPFYLPARRTSTDQDSNCTELYHGTIFAAMTGQKLKLDGGGKSVRVFIDMRDVSDATLKIAENGKLGETYHISGYELVSIRNLVEMIIGNLGKKFEECVEIGPDRPGKDTAYTLDSFKIRTELGWRDSIGLEQGIADTIEWMRRNEAKLDKLPSSYIHKA